MKVLVNDVLAARLSSIPIRSPFSKRHCKIEYDARPTIEAKRIGNTVGPYLV
jgi:hypothetical protein